MTTLAQYNASYGIEGQLRFIQGKGDMPTVEISNDLAQASIALQGAHVLGFQAKGQAPLIWMSPDATFAVGKSLRGGIPVCWPWFGPHVSESSFPGHGPVRTCDWQATASSSNDDGSTSVSFAFIPTEASRQQFGDDVSVHLHVTVGTALHLKLETTNGGDSDFTLGQALHTYFNVGDVRQASIQGLDSCSYIDKMDGASVKQQAGAVEITSETDRIYLNTSSQCEIIDPVLSRKIIIASEGSASTVVWNPWIETANKMGDLGTDGYLNMLCVETANAADDVIQLAAGDRHRLSATYSSQAL